MKYVHEGAEEACTTRKIEPYVVQRKGEKYLKKDGSWTKNYEPSQVFLPLEDYEFEGWT
ncbi:MAG: hypothetical protein KFB95_04470 [Simkaniaceae bacterium]|nr:MAG: hypothetical protein KFB95_04470 [Simkaniaceae bacterium]